MSDINRLYVMDVTCFEDEELFKACYDQMSDPRKKKIDAYKPNASKRLSLGAGILLDRGLSEAGVSGYELELGDQNKPFLKDRSDIFFNISHSGNMAAVAISDRAVGVDIEEHRHFDDGLIDYVFNESDKKTALELEALYKDKDIAYTALWTVKESIMKHSGMGVSLEPKKIYLSPAFFNDSLNISAYTSSYDCTELHFSLFSIPCYNLTVCSEYEDFPSPVKVVL